MNSITPKRKPNCFLKHCRPSGHRRGIVLCFTGDERANAVMSRNIPKVENTPTENLNVMQLLDREYLIITEAGIKNLEGRFVAWDKKEGQ